MAKKVIPIVGPRTTKQLSENLAAADLELSPEQIGRLDAASAIRLGYPHNLRADPGALGAVTGSKSDLLDAPAFHIA
jgi:diketogulonate reductase-like aldo/keto reductase